MNLPENVQFEILLNTPYRDIINLCKTSKSFDKICQKPYLWARKAELDFGIIPQDLQHIPGDTNKDKYIWIMKADPEVGLDQASSIGSLPLVKYFLDKGAKDYNQAMAYAAEGGHLDIIKMMLDLGATDYDRAMASAARGGHLDIVKMMLDLGATDYDLAMPEAAGGGHLGIVKMMIDLGAEDYNSGMIEAAGNGHLNVVKFLLEKSKQEGKSYDINEIIHIAASLGQAEIVKFLLENETPDIDYDEIIEVALKDKQYKIVALVADYVANNV